MNFNFSKFCDAPACSTSSIKFSKKFRRKRRRNKYKNLATKKKNQKQYISSNGVHISEKFKFKNLELNKSQQNFDINTLMCDWYWSNYKKAFEWQRKHSLAYWKSYALALQEENRYLLQIIKSLRPDMVVKTPVSFRDEHNFISEPQTTSSDVNMHSSSCLKDINYENSENPENSENDDYEIEMSEEMMQYFKQSFTHKMNLEKEKKENELQDMDNKVKELQENRMKRLFEMELLYGDDASKIIGMETAIQLTYDKYCEQKAPKYWPFKLY